MKKEMQKDDAKSTTKNSYLESLDDDLGEDFFEFQEWWSSSMDDIGWAN